jgi:hypothetical protein
MNNQTHQVALTRKAQAKTHAALAARQLHTSEVRKRIAERPQLKLLPKESRCCELATD